MSGSVVWAADALSRMARSRTSRRTPGRIGVNSALRTHLNGRHVDHEPDSMSPTENQDDRGPSIELGQFAVVSLLDMSRPDAARVDVPLVLFVERQALPDLDLASR